MSPEDSPEEPPREHRRGSVRADKRARELSAEYMFMMCDHVNRCCSPHGVHVTPHRGCILR